MLFGNPIEIEWRVVRRKPNANTKVANSNTRALSLAYERSPCQTLVLDGAGHGGAHHSYRILEKFTAVEVTHPPAPVHSRDE